MDSVTLDAPRPRRTKPKGRHPHNRLAAAFIRSAPVGRHGDGNGLYLYVQRTGTRSWIQRLVIRGRKHELGLGSVNLVSLAEAREQALANRKLARAGGDPLADKRRTQGMPTFADAAATVVEQKRAGWRSRRQATDWFHSLERYVFPRIGSRPVSEVSSADVLAVLTPIWHVKPDTARRLRQRIHAVLEWSIAMEHRTDNPCDRIGPVLGPQRDIVRHMRALPHRDVAAAVETVQASRSTRAVKLAFEFLVVTATRSGEVRLATWEEMNVAGRVWTIPAERMKMNREHRVPLSSRAFEVLDAARSLAEGNRLVFPNRWGNRIRDTFLSQLLKDLDIAVGRPQFSWTRIKGESDVAGGRGYGWVEAGEGSWVGADGGSPEGDRSRRRRGGGGVGGLGAGPAVEREPETGRGVAAAAWRAARRGVA